MCAVSALIAHRTALRGPAGRRGGLARGQRYVPGRSGPGWPGRRPAGPAGDHAGPSHARWQLAHLLELLAGGQLLGEQRRLDPVEQPLQPADELRLGDADLRFGRDLAVLERQGQHLQLLLQIRRQRVGQLGDRALVDLRQPLSARLVERRRPNLLEQRLHHRTDPHHLGRRRDGLVLGGVLRPGLRALEQDDLVGLFGRRLRGRRSDIGHGVPFVVVMRSPRATERRPLPA